MMKLIKSRLRQFRQGEDGSIIAESVIMFPTLFAAVLATFVFFDAFRNQAVNLKANYTIADSVSRQTEYVTNTQMLNTWNLHRFLTRSPTLTQIRISVITFDEVSGNHRIVWSRAKGGGDSYDDKPVSLIGLNASQIPVMPDNEILIVVQTSVDYEPGFSIGFGAFTFDNISYTRPRGNPEQLCYSHNGTDGGRICPIGG